MLKLFQKRYLVTVVDEANLPLKQAVTASNRDDAKAQLEKEGLRILAIEERPNTWLKDLQAGQLRIPIGKPVKSKDIAIFSRQLAQMIANGVNLNRTFDLLGESTKNYFFKQVIKGLKTRVSEGETIAQAMSAYPEVFDTTYVAIIQAAESSGQIPTALKELTHSLKRGDKVIRKVKNASIYPTGVLCVAFISFMVFVTFVIPKLEKIYKQLGGELPLPTRIMLATSRFMRSNPLVPAGVALFPVFVFFNRRLLTEKPWFQRTSLKVPGVGAIIEKTALLRILQLKAQFASAGVSIQRQYILVEKAAGNAAFSESMRNVRNSIMSGNPESLAWMQQRLLPQMIGAQLQAAEATGSTADLLKDLTEAYSEDLDDAVTAFTALIEPALIVVLVLFIGTMVISMYLPLFNLAKAMRRH